MDPRLRKALDNGDLPALRRALDDGADPNLSDDGGYTPLIHAANVNHVGCVARLIEAGANPNCHAGSCTPLNFAASYGRIALIRVLLAGGAQVDFAPPDSQYRSPLRCAIRHVRAPSSCPSVTSGWG